MPIVILFTFNYFFIPRLLDKGQFRAAPFFLIIFCVVEKLHKANRTYKAKRNKYSELHIAATCIFMFNML